MMCLDPFRRAAVLALAWCLVGLGIDTGADSSTAPARPDARPTAWVPCQFATAGTNAECPGPRTDIQAHHKH